MYKQRASRWHRSVQSSQQMAAQHQRSISLASVAAQAPSIRLVTGFLAPYKGVLHWSLLSYAAAPGVPFCSVSTLC